MLGCVTELCLTKPVGETGSSGCGPYICKKWAPLSAEYEPPYGYSQSVGLYVFIPT